MEETNDKNYLLSDGNLGWLAGILDGEGCLSIYRRTCNIKLKDGGIKKLVCPGPYISVTNTNLKLIERCIDTFDALNLKYHISNNSYKALDKKMSKRIKITTYSSLIILMNTIKPFMVGKSTQLDLLLQFLSMYKKQDEASYNMRRELLEKIQFENKKGSLIPRDYTR